MVPKQFDGLTYQSPIGAQDYNEAYIVPNCLNIHQHPPKLLAIILQPGDNRV